MSLTQLAVRILEQVSKFEKSFLLPQSLESRRMSSVTEKVARIQHEIRLITNQLTEVRTITVKYYFTVYMYYFFVITRTFQPMKITKKRKKHTKKLTKGWFQIKILINSKSLQLNLKKNEATIYMKKAIVRQNRTNCHFHIRFGNWLIGKILMVFFNGLKVGNG